MIKYQAAPYPFATHRIILTLILLIIFYFIVTELRWDWLPKYLPKLWQGLWVSLAMLFSTVILGFLLALPLGLVQVTGPRYLSSLAAGFCTVIRGTPLLLQLWLIYYGLGSVMAQFPELRDTWMWPYLRQAWPYAVLALTFSFAGYEGEVMRGAFAGVPRGELEAGRALGMSPTILFRRIWLPRAIRRALPTLMGEVILQLKSTPLVATVTVIDLYAVITRIRQDTFITYEPLLLLAAIYMILTGLLTLLFKWYERRVPSLGV